jgi:lysozyme
MSRSTLTLALLAGLAGVGYYIWKSMARSNADPTSANVAAFLAMLRHSEGTDQYADPWGTYYGGAQFSDKSDHPAITGVEQAVDGPSGPTTAAGAYQIEETTWTDLGGRSHYGDFSDDAQDRAALDLIERRGATSAMESGQFAQAVALLGKEWASLPGSPYGQPVNTLADLQSFYQSQGGAVAA